jgi:hypothetical protein
MDIAEAQLGEQLTNVDANLAGAWSWLDNERLHP